jgi:lipoprotein signal peptidase
MTLNHWPVFNVADSYVTVGYVLLAWTFFGHRRRGIAIERAPG